MTQQPAGGEQVAGVLVDAGGEPVPGAMECLRDTKGVQVLVADVGDDARVHRPGPPVGPRPHRPASAQVRSQLRQQMLTQRDDALLAALPVGDEQRRRIVPVADVLTVQASYLSRA